MSVGGSEGPVMRNTDALFGMGLGGGSGGATSPSPATHGMRVAYSAADGTAIYKSATPPPGSSLSPPPPPPPAAAAAPENHHHHQYSLSYQQQQPMMMMKKKRGRPRKYSGGVGGTDVAMPLALMPPAAAQPTSAAAVPPQTTAGGESGGPTLKKARGRPPGSTNKIKPLQHHFQPIPLSGSCTTAVASAAAGSAGVGFTPHVISVKAGEDVSSKIMSFSQNGPRAVCILSANGAISNVTLRQAATSGGTATYEGRFEILSLCGSFMLTEVGGHKSRTGGLSVSLAGPDGRVLGGCVAGLLTAASPVQVIVGSFIPDGRKEFTKAAPQNHADPTTRQLSTPPQMPIPMPMPMSMSVMSPPVLFSSSGGGSGYTGGGTAAGGGGGVRSPPSDDGGGSLIGESSSGEEEEDEEEEGGGEGGSPPPNHHHTTGGTASNNHHHQQQHHHTNNNNTNNPHAMLGMPWR